MESNVVKLEIGYGLVSLADKKNDSILVKRIKELREKIPKLPIVRIVDNFGLEAYQFCFKGQKYNMNKTDDFCEKIISVIKRYMEQTIKD